MAGLLRSLTDRFQPTPLSMGLINAGANMMMAGGPSRMPVNLGSTLGAGLQGLLQGYSIENEAQSDRGYQAEMMRRQAENDAIELQIKQAQLANVGKPAAGTPGQWYIPAGAVPFSDPATGFTGYKTKEGALIPSRFAQTEYQQNMTNPNVIGQIAAAREGEKFQNIPMGPEGVPTVTKNKYLETNLGNMRPRGANTGFQDKVPVTEDLARMDKNLQAYGNKGISTLRDAISRWSPPNENDTGRLIAQASTITGINPDEPIDLSDHATRAKLIDAITIQEGTNKQLFPRPQTEAQKETIKNKAEVEKQKSLMDLKETKPIYDTASDEFVYPPTPENPQGKRTVSPNRMKAFDSMNYTMDRFVGTPDKPGLLYSVPTGGPLGIKGTIAKATEYQKIKEFESEKAQLLGDMKQALRIPGEGVFTDKDAEQLGFQLPDIHNDPEVNRRIIEDLKAKMSLKLGIKQAQQGGDIHSEAERILRGQ